MKFQFLLNSILYLIKKSEHALYYINILLRLRKNISINKNEIRTFDQETNLINLEYQAYANKLCIFYSWSELSTIKFELGYVKSLQLAGFEVVVVTSPEIQIMKVWKNLGIKKIFHINNLKFSANYKETYKDLKKINKFEDVKRLTHMKINYGKYIKASIMRKYQEIEFDITNKKFKNIIYKYIYNSHSIINYLETLNNKFKPSIVYMMDQNYSPRGELFDYYTENQIPVFTNSTGYKANTFILKKYFKYNRNSHPFGISNENWEKFKVQNFNENNWTLLKKELEICYQSGNWYPSAASSSFSNMNNDLDLEASLGLESEKKTAVIFSHIFWDATFFWGDDLFSDYEEWFIETLKIASLNKNVNWIIKIHPSNIVRVSEKTLKSNKFSENISIENKIGILPDHIKIIYPNSNISTYSLFQKIDYCITVRGTVGMECAALGVTVLTAGTGRYDNKGFTYDSNNIEGYKEKIRNIHNLSKIKDNEILLARKFLFMSLFHKVFDLNFIKHKYEVSGNQVKEITTMNVIKDLENYEEINSIKEWLLLDNEDFLVNKL